MSVAIIGTVGVPACYGGFETLVDNLLGEELGGVTVYCSRSSYKSRPPTYKGAKLKYLPFNANGAQSIIYDAWSMCDAVLKNHRALLILGVSGAIVLPFLRLFTSARVVTNIDGLEWRREKWGRFARWFLKFSERIAVQYSDVIISDNQAIADYVLDEYDVESTVIAYGGDHALTGSFPERHSCYALSLCRIEPENNCHLILEAFLENGCHLKFIGNWEFSDYGRSLKERYSKVPNIEIIDPIYNIDLLFELRSHCAFYVHGHSAGGTNPSLVEMMFLNRPIICFDCSYNRATTEDQAFYFGSAYELAKFNSEKVPISFGSTMREIANRRYTWKAVRQQYLNVLDINFL